MTNVVVLAEAPQLNVFPSGRLQATKTGGHLPDSLLRPHSAVGRRVVEPLTTRCMPDARLMRARASSKSLCAVGGALSQLTMSVTSAHGSQRAGRPAASTWVNAKPGETGASALLP
ncbi:hypothetical protein GCM10009721_39280 [Terrabacter tumescens]|uniref:Uncharacterized protein n=1 Tax=Terrabacter tumescens TaxID=60443 RepID=A0ABQ2IER9_9MICO|nr:hypothetical protein GCM10009721_39280 [Terrabacter tumescens]